MSEDNIPKWFNLNDFTSTLGYQKPAGPYLDRLKDKQAKLVNEIHQKHRELATVSALIQFLIDKPEIADVAERVMEV